MQVPLLDIKAQNAPLRADFIAAFERVLDSGGYILGPEVESFEREVAAYARCSHGLGMTSGTDALLVALMALDIGQGDEVLVPAFTFFATAGCVARLGATPVFVDSREADYNMDPADLAAKITPRSKAIVPVHLFGQMAPMKEIMEVADAHDLPVIEDAAQALGASLDGKPACSVGLIGVTSFYPTKNLGAFGDAGMLLTNSPEMAEKCHKLRNHGMQPRYYHALLGGNFRLDAIQAALLRLKLPKINTYAEGRSRHAAGYIQQLAERSWASEQAEASDARLILPAVLPGSEHVWNQFTVRVRGTGQRDALKKHLGERGIGSEVYYPLTLDMQECFQGKSRGGESCNVAHMLAEEVLSLPVYPEMSGEQQDYVVESLDAFFG